jgi:hypothetical protein
MEGKLKMYKLPSIAFDIHVCTARVRLRVCGSNAIAVAVDKDNDNNKSNNNYNIKQSFSCHQL